MTLEAWDELLCYDLGNLSMQKKHTSNFVSKVVRDPCLFTLCIWFASALSRNTALFDCRDSPCQQKLQNAKAFGQNKNTSFYHSSGLPKSFQICWNKQLCFHLTYVHFLINVVMTLLSEEDFCHPSKLALLYLVWHQS